MFVDIQDVKITRAEAVMLLLDIEVLAGKFHRRKKDSTTEEG